MFARNLLAAALCFGLVAYVNYDAWLGGARGLGLRSVAAVYALVFVPLGLLNIVVAMGRRSTCPRPASFSKSSRIWRSK